MVKRFLKNLYDHYTTKEAKRKILNKVLHVCCSKTEHILCVLIHRLMMTRKRITGHFYLSFSLPSFYR